MPVTYLNATTLTNAITASQTTFLVGSNTNHTVGELIAVGSELMLIQSKVGSLQISVERGQGGSDATAHMALTPIFGSATSQLVTVSRDALGGKRVQLSDTQPTGLPPYYLPLGTRVRDEQGNEYMLCDFNAAVYNQQPVSIAANFVADVLTATWRGMVGVVAETAACTSDNWGWVQIFGRCLIMLGMSGVSPSDAANGPTTLSTSAQTKFILGTSLTTPNAIGWTTDSIQTSTGYYFVEGITVAQDASVGDVSAVTSQTAHTGNRIAVFLNYPRVLWLDITT